MTEAFVYCWTDHKTNKLYVGSHKGTTNDGYVCSSKHMMKEYKNDPERQKQHSERMKIWWAERKAKQ